MINFDRLINKYDENSSSNFFFLHSQHEKYCLKHLNHFFSIYNSWSPLKKPNYSTHIKSHQQTSYKREDKNIYVCCGLRGKSHSNY